MLSIEKKGGLTGSKSVSVCVVGLGNIGYPTACHISNHGFSVRGYDCDEKKTTGVNAFSAFNEWTKVPESEIYVICVNSGWKNGKPSMSNIFDTCRKIREKSKKPLVCIESTVSVGTCRKLGKMFDAGSLVYVPHRYWSGDPERHGVKQIRVMGAQDEESLVKAKKFYSALEIPVYTVTSIEVAEMIKIAENAYRFVQIAFVEELKLLCEKTGIPFDEVRRGANTKWNISLLEVCEGIGGECLPKDIRYLTWLGEAPLLRGAVEADKKYIEHLAK